MGVTPDLFEVGQTIKVAGRVSTRRDRHLLGLNVLLADNTEVRLSRDDPPYWGASNVIGSEGAVPFNEVALRNAATEDRGLERRADRAQPESPLYAGCYRRSSRLASGRQRHRSLRAARYARHNGRSATDPLHRRR
jgi:hypothetical protein